MALLLSACLIVRDEAERIIECLDALAGVVDEVVVHDTGSVDGTLEILRRRDLVLVEGGWDDDFAGARNVALAAARGEWVLSLDADEVLASDAAALRDLLSSTSAARLLVHLDNSRPDEADYTFTAVRLFRRVGARWTRRVHERIATPDQASGLVPRETLVLRHHGYQDAQRLKVKSARNAALAQAELDHLLSLARIEPDEVAGAALDLGRSCVGTGELQRAVDAFEAVREVALSGQVRLEATDFLARVLLGAGESAGATVLAGELRSAGVEAAYCDWLLAQAEAQAGRPQVALDLLSRVDRIVDPAGRRHDVRAVAQLAQMCRELLAAADQMPMGRTC